LELFQHKEARQKVNAMPCEQALIQKNEVWFVQAKEFGGRQPIRSDDNLGIGLLFKQLTKVDNSGKVIHDEKYGL
jgi:hypothetical protein